MTSSGRSLLRQASVLLAVCCAALVAANPALAQDPAPEPAPPKTSSPRPEPPPSADRQPQTPRVTPPAPPATPPATPPPAAVTPPPAPAVTPVVSQPPPAPTRRVSPIQRREPAKPKARPKPKPKPAPDRTFKQASAASLAGISREQATSPDTMLMVGGLALFVLVLADVVFLTMSTRVLRSG